VFWFEQPIVCRWESNEETVVSDKLDEIHEAEEAVKAAAKAAADELEQKREAALAAQDTEAEGVEDVEEEVIEVPAPPPIAPLSILSLIARTKKMMMKKREQRAQFKTLADVRTIVDFDLHQISWSRVNLAILLKDFVLPKLPDQYGIRIKEMGATNDDAFRTAAVPSKLEQLIYETKAPRSLFPLCLHQNKNKRIDKILKIYTTTKGKCSSNTSSDLTADDSSSDDEPQQLEANSTPKYMFSEFLQDLDELNELIVPQYAAKLEQISSKLDEVVESSPVPTEPSEHDSDKPTLQNQLSQMSLTQDLQDPDVMAKDPDSAKKSMIEGLNEFSSSESESDVSSDDQDVQITVQSADDQGRQVQHCQADEKKSILDGKWSTRDIHDVKYNEDKYAIQFRAGRLGTFGFAATRLSNFPFQAWELKPDVKGYTTCTAFIFIFHLTFFLCSDPNNIIFSLTAAVISLELTITSDGVRLNSLQGGPTSALQQFIDIPMKLPELIRHMRSACANIFPEADTFAYIEGACEKNYVMEHHLYACMATLALTHNFAWSRWNIVSGSRMAVVLMREIVENRKLVSTKLNFEKLEFKIKLF
jgi:cancer susceptibility candidate protein 1